MTGQACIDDNLDMVEFLVANGADVDRGDNEGWTPLHATASCGFLSIARFLLDHGSNVAAVNNDGELAIDISESDEMEELLQKEIDAQKVNCDEARNREEQYMLDDARDWKNSGKLGDRPHHKTGATALHVAAAKGYTKVMSLLIQAGCEVNQQDFDGWTPLHAAAHWAQREACELLTDAYVNMDIKNCVGQTPFDVADPDVLRLLEELKKKQNNCSKDRPDIRALITRPPTTPGLGKGGRRSSITRLSQQEKVHSTREITAKETIKEEKASILDASESDRESNTDTSESARPRDSPGVVVTDESGKEAQPSFLPPHPEVGQLGKDDGSAPWRRPGSLRARPTASGMSGKLSPSSEDLVTVRRAHSFGSDEKFYAKLAELRQRIRANSMPVLNKELEEDPASRPARKSMSEVPSANNMLSQSASLPRPSKATRLPSLVESQQLQLELRELEKPPRVEPKRDLESRTINQHNLQPELSQRIIPTASDPERPPLPPKPSTPSFSNFIIAPQPFRRTEGEPEAPSLAQQAIQSWRRISEDISKQSPDLRPRSQENLAVGRTLPAAPAPAAAQVRRSFVPPVRDEEHEIQRKAHAKRVRETRRSTQGVTLEDLKSAEQLVKKKQQQENAQRTTELQQLASSSPTSIGSTATPTTGGSSPPTPPGSTATTTVTTSATLVTGGSRDSDQEKHERRPSWRLRIESNDKSRNVPTSSSQTSQEFKTRSSLKSQNGEIDYKKLWEESQAENARLRLDMNSIRSDLDSTRHQLEAAIQASAKNNVSDTEKREKKVLEKKLAEMEEELKQLQKLKSENEKLKSENRALTRVVSKLTAAATKSGPTQPSQGPQVRK